MSVRLEVVSASGATIASAVLKDGVTLRFYAPNESRMGHIKPGADVLAQGLGLPVEYVVDADINRQAERPSKAAVEAMINQAMAEDDEAESQEIERAIGEGMNGHGSHRQGNRTRDLPKHKAKRG